MPALPRTPLAAEIVRKTNHGPFWTEAILLETLPGFFIGGTVYRPSDTTRRWPVVLIPHGHWKHGRVEDLPSYSVPALGANLAMQGYLAFAWDMVGYNDAKQVPHDFGGWREHLWGFTPLGLQVLNGTRAIDYVASRTDTDSRRIACTGASGGATQTILLSALDSRITCSAPVNMISAHYQGADPCEEAPNLRLGTNNVEIASLTAPRPMLVVSCTGDWTRNTPTSEFPAMQQVYSLYDRSSQIENAHFQADHNYNAKTREAVYRFFAKHMLDRPDLRPKDEWTPEFRHEDLLSGKPASDLFPALSYEEVFEQWRLLCGRRNAASSPAERRRGLATVLMCEWPTRVGASDLGDHLVLSRAGRNDRVAVRSFDGRGTPAIVLHPEGSAAAEESGAVAALRAAGRPVLTIDLFQTGTAKMPRDRGGRWHLSYNQTDDAHRVQDILTAIVWLRTRTRSLPELIAYGGAGRWAVLAAAVAPVQIAVSAEESDMGGSDEEMKDNCFVPCLRAAGGLQVARELVKVAPLRWGEEPPLMIRTSNED